MQRSGQIETHDGTTCDIKRVSVSVAANGNHAAVLAAVTNRKLRIISAILSNAGTATTITFESNDGAGNVVAISPLLSLPVNTPVVLPEAIHGWFDSQKGDAITATSSNTAAVGLQLNYIEAP